MFGVLQCLLVLMHENGDAFQGCAVGAASLNEVSQYLIYTPETDLQQESGSTIYGTVAVAEGTDTTHLYYNVLVNASSLHSAGIYMNLVHQSYLQVISGKPAATIVTHNHPLPQTYKEQNQQATIDAFVVSLFYDCILLRSCIFRCVCSEGTRGLFIPFFLSW